jgi:hypothetical protein
MAIILRRRRGLSMSSRFGPPGINPGPKLTKVMPEIWRLVRPRRWPLADSFLLISVNRPCSFYAYLVPLPDK